LTTDGIFVLQCGDPTGTGTGSPGYTTPDENLEAVAADFEDAGNGQVIYPRGTIAMANSGPNTNGSQFFIVYKDSPLAPAYTVVGQLTKGLEIIDAVAAEGVAGGAADGKPAQALELEKVLSFERRQVEQ
jgi:cyclophilin family peptidyl-prolyl cis-trans isomerase